MMYAQPMSPVMHVPNAPFSPSNSSPQPQPAAVYPVQAQAQMGAPEVAKMASLADVAQQAEPPQMNAADGAQNARFSVYAEDGDAAAPGTTDFDENEEAVMYQRGRG